MQAECMLRCFKETKQKNTDVWGPHLDHRSSGSILRGSTATTWQGGFHSCGEVCCLGWH